MSSEQHSQRAWTRRALGTAVLGSTVLAATATGAAAQRPNPSPTSCERSANGRLHEIRSGRHRVVIAGVAATLLSWQVDGTELLLTHPAEEMGEGYQGKTILPWPNRIDRGRYSFDGQELQVPVNEPKRNAALHGLMNFAEWELVEHARDRVVLRSLLYPHYGYPFSLAFEIEYAVTGDGVRSTLIARNAGSTSAPFGTATHGYIAASAGKINSMELELPASTYYRTNDRLIPVGTSPVDGTEYDFRTARRIGSTTMDTAFTDLTRRRDGTAVVRFGRPGGENVEMWVDETHDYLQVYTDDAPSAERPQRARSGVTVEPMTCPPNAFVTGEGVIVLRPGQQHRGSWGYRVAE
ncbi:aldose 1-epimerase family protein [Haloactinomyces albus]|uniref:Aldose 1-epimerase n=1 Tax=Haloactinomyces albus TaxID=1352928 RepID=A0AAE3ZI76_9ACTN|nr:aldose 1-epimerase family protein [Haloactinomyces albus]MDR7304130.1 aldose 1-epimerase [Haloactinomyces albus]